MTCDNYKINSFKSTLYRRILKLMGYSFENFPEKTILEFDKFLSDNVNKMDNEKMQNFSKYLKNFQR